MTLQEAKNAFNAQEPVILLAAIHAGFHRDILCKRIDVLGYQITAKGEKCYFVRAVDQNGNATYTGGLESFRTVEQEAGT